MFPTRQAPDEPSGQKPGLRSRKKIRTRQAIQDAAQELFVEQGYETTTVDQIAARADISTATFFRYFGGKADAVFGGESDDRLDALPTFKQAIIDRPAEEGDLTAIRRAVLEVWVPLLEPERTRRSFLAAETSPVLVGLSNNLTRRWQATIAEALAVRRGLDSPDHKCTIAAAMAQATLTETATAWVHGDILGDLVDAFDHGYQVMSEVCAEMTATSPER